MLKNDTPKIAHVVCSYPPYRGGMGNVAFEYVERLRARGMNVHVFTTKQGGKEVDDPRYVHRIPGVLNIGNAGVLPSLFHRLSGFDLVHLHYPFYGGAEPTIVRKAMRHDQGLIMTYHMDAVASGAKGAIFSAHRRLLFPWLINRVDRILVSTQDYADTSALAEIDRVMDRVEVHPFGVDLDRFYPGTDDDIRSLHKVKHGAPVMLFVGGLDSAHHFKGVHVLIDALEKLGQHEWHCLIVGSGDLKESYEKAVAEKGLASRVSFAGNVSDDDLPRYYRAADMHLFPSTKRAEAFGIVAAEAAASGIPTIASDLPGVRIVVRDGDTGLLVPPENVEELSTAILLLLEQSDLRERFGLSARQHAMQSFDWEPLIDKLVETYDSVLGQQSARTYKV
ncbi:glycosyltransferase family 4 protein [Candidatus Uhrbacteria bacterium]|jgi:glycosyltransferase involved in cell wall biosynthesis|nr:glycosyltransferase family 4 protein [Candidatus Uhrbacteria bacterium]